MKRYYIGLANTLHDPSVALVNQEGEVLFAEATERFLQRKMAVGSIPDVSGYIGKLIQKYCEPGSSLIVSSTWKRNIFLKQGDGKSPSVRRSLEGVDEADMRFWQKRRSSFFEYIASMQTHTFDATTKGLLYDLSLLKGAWTRSEVEYRRYEHALTHAATACYTSPFDEAICVIVEGMNDDSADFRVFRYQSGALSSVDFVMGSKTTDTEFPVSLGSMFGLATQACGFGMLTGEEWKVMGLAPYGKLDADLEKVINDAIGQESGLAEKLKFAEYLCKIERPTNADVIVSADLAFTAQKCFTERLFSFLNALYELNPSDNLILGGGCALNSSANGLVTKRTPFKNLHVYSAPADDGNSLGAAFLAYREDNPKGKLGCKQLTPYLGSSISSETIQRLIEFNNNITVIDEAKVPALAAQLLHENMIIGWVQGKAEFGPRALGNRSILANPTNPKIKEWINDRVKFREEFRPFAPSILHQYGREYFEDYEDSPYMERTLAFRENKRYLVPGVVHVNGTGRVQSVTAERNPKFFSLISAFYDLCEIPLVLNTSFNVMGKPIVHTVEDVLGCFFTTGLDAVFIENILIRK